MGSVRDMADQVKGGMDAAGAAGSQATNQMRVDYARLGENIKRVSEELAGARRAALGFGGETTEQMGKALVDVRNLGEQLKYLKAEQAKTDPKPTEQKTDWKRVKESMETLLSVTNRMNLALSGTVGMFARAGFAGTTHGEALHQQFLRLSRGVSGIFVPDMNKLIDVVVKAANWFQNLTGEQQQVIAHKIKTAAIALTLVGVFGKLIPMVLNVVRAVKALTVAKLGLTAATGGWLGIATAFAGAMAVIQVSSMLADHGLDMLGDAFDEVGDKAKRSFKNIEEAMSFVESKRGFWQEVGATIEGGAETALKGFGLWGDIRTRAGDIRKEAEGIMKAQKAGTQRTDVELSRTGKEAITATIERLQSASLRQDYPKKTAENTTDLVALMRMLTEHLNPETLATAMGRGMGWLLGGQGAVAGG